MDQGLHLPRELVEHRIAPLWSSQWPIVDNHLEIGFRDLIELRFVKAFTEAGASGFFSSILREPLVGHEAILPVPLDIRHWFASPRAAVGFLIHAGMLDLAPVGPRRNLDMPGISATVGDEIEALRRFAGDKAVRLIRHEPDETVTRIVGAWAQGFNPQRALALGFVSEPTFDDFIRAHVEDELGGTIGA